MPVNSSSALNSPACAGSTFGGSMINIFFITKVILFLPLSLLVLYLGQQRWRQQRSFTTTSHSDIFTYHTAVMELIYVLGVIFYFCGKYSDLNQIVIVASCLCSVCIPGETSFHILTCVERYLAVVHPIFYLGLKQPKGVKIRNISVGCVWLLCFGWTVVTAFHFRLRPPFFLYFCFLLLSLLVVSFCSLSVLRILNHAGPGKLGKDRQLDQSKQKAFYTITTITGVLLFYFTVFIVCVALEILHSLSFIEQCMVHICANLATLPSSLVLPLLFLQRSGIRVCFQ